MRLALFADRLGVALPRRLQEDVAMMHDRGIARQNLGGFHPDIVLESRIDQNVLILDDPLRRHGERLRQRDDAIGPADAPAFGKRRRRRQIGFVPFGTASVDPGEQRPLRRFAQRRIVRKMKGPRIDTPRRHAPGGDILADRFRPVLRIVVSQQGKRPSLAGTMAHLAVLLQKGSDVFAIGRRRFGLLVPNAANRTADGRRLGHRYGPVGQQSFDGVAQFRLCRLGAALADVVLIVDAAAIADLPLPIEDERFRRPLRAEAVGDDIARVLHKRERQIVFARETMHIG
jgi:hypothetical protein